MKKIIVFGASGATGLQFVKQGLDAGYAITAIVRNPAALALEHTQLTVIRGDVMEKGTFAEAMKGKDAVVSALGNRSTKPTTVYSAGMKNIMEAMKENGVKRIICITAGALYTNPKMGFFIRLLTKAVLQRILKEPYADMRLMEKEIQQSGLDYTIMRPPMLKDKPPKKKYRIAVNGHITRPFSIARADLAHYMVNHINDNQTFKSIVEISY